MGNHTAAAEYAQRALESMQLVVGGFHPALQPYYQLLTQRLAKAGDTKAAEQVKAGRRRWPEARALSSSSCGGKVGRLKAAAISS